MIAALAGCGGGASRDAGGASGAAVSNSTAATAAPRAAAPRDTIPFDESDVVKPALRYGSFLAAEDAAKDIVSRSLGSYADSAVWKRGAIAFEYRDSIQLLSPVGGGRSMWVISGRDAPPVNGLGCSLSIANSRRFDSEMTVLDALRHAGWIEDGQYTADGPDGGTMALVCEEAICHCAASWEGGDESDTTVVPAPWMKIELQIVPRFPVRRGALAAAR